LAEAFQAAYFDKVFTKHAQAELGTDEGD